MLETLTALSGSLFALILLTILLIVIVTLRPGLAEGRGGMILISVIFVAMPFLALVTGTNSHLENSKTTSFCLSCHVMDDYGKTLWLDDTNYLAASHFQNNRIDGEHACFTCHTTYTMFGDLQAKMAGFKHLVVNYLGTVSDPIELYRPYDNRECLYCHEEGRQYDDMHSDFEAELVSGETSCLDCHDLVHPVEEVEELPLWQGAAP